MKITHKVSNIIVSKLLGVFIIVLFIVLPFGSKALFNHI